MPEPRPGADPGSAARTPWAQFWRQLRRSPLAVLGGVLLVVLYAMAVFAPFLAPYAESDLDRMRFYHPPTPLHWHEASGRWHLLPFVSGTTEDADGRYHAVPGEVHPLRLFVTGAPYRLFGVLPARVHLFGTDPGARVYLLGADNLGRDQWTRLLYGAQVSLTVGLVGIAISFSIGLILGGISGYFGGWVDTVVMRFTEMLLSIPSLYLIIALRAVFPANLPSQQVYLAIVVVLAFIGWAGLARVIRGMVLGLRKAEYVMAAEALGMSRMRVIVRHILPNTMSFVIVAATIAVPGFILGEVFLSFLGMGVQEPSASWGNMLQQARSLEVMRSSPWMLFAPGGAIFVTVIAFNFLGDGLRDALDPRKAPGGK